MQNKMTTIRIDAFIDIILIFAIAVIMLFSNFENNIDLFYVVMSICSVVITIITLKFQAKIHGNLFNFSNLFIILCWVFTFGQVLLMAIFSCTGITGYTIVIDYYGASNTIYALRIILCIYSAVCVGLLVSGKNSVNINETQNIRDYNEEKIQLENERRYAKNIILITFPVRIITDTLILLAGLRGGLVGSTSMTAAIPDIVISYGNFSIIGLALYVHSLKHNKKQQTLIFFAIVFYFCLMMLNGRRSETVAYLCVIGLVYVSTRGRVKAVKLLGYFILAYVFLAILYSVVSMRVLYGTNSLSSFLSCLGQSLTTKNIVFEALREYGNTCYTPISVLVRWLPQYGPSWGTSYYYGATAVLINIFGIAGKLTKKSNYGFALQETSGVLSQYYYNIGGSAFGELFFNFGVVGGIVVAIFVGIMIGKISKKVGETIHDNNNWESIAYMIPLMTSLLYWIRDYFSGGIREAVWGVLFVYFTRKLIFKRK